MKMFDKSESFWKNKFMSETLTAQNHHPRTLTLNQKGNPNQLITEKRGTVPISPVNEDIRGMFPVLCLFHGFMYMRLKQVHLRK